MVFCMGCGQRLPDSARFCAGCGTPVAVAAAPPTVVPSPYPSAPGGAGSPIYPQLGAGAPPPAPRPVSVATPTPMLPPVMSFASLPACFDAPAAVRVTSGAAAAVPAAERKVERGGPAVAPGAAGSDA